MPATVCLTHGLVLAGGEAARDSERPMKKSRIPDLDELPRGAVLDYLLARQLDSNGRCWEREINEAARHRAHGNEGLALQAERRAAEWDAARARLLVDSTRQDPRP